MHVIEIMYCKPHMCQLLNESQSKDIQKQR
jgi:hypothetical protein